jgi:DNA gyrase subunit B
VVDNSIDEAMAGYCSVISIEINKDSSLTVEDNGRGIPIGIHKKEGVSALEVVMTKIGAGGKFDKDSYKVSGGLHGVGVSCVNALSSNLNVEVHREGKIFQQEYKIGVPQYDVREIGKTSKTGTYVTFHPDKTIFEDTVYHFDILVARLRELAFLNKGINLSITDKRRQDDQGAFVKETFYSEGGLKEFVAFLDSTRDSILEDIIYIDGEKDGVPVEVAMVYNNSYTENIHSYVNNINTHEGGTHLSGFRRGLTRTLKKYADESGLLKKVKFEISGDDFREGLTAVISVKVMEPPI